MATKPASLLTRLRYAWQPGAHTMSPLAWGLYLLWLLFMIYLPHSLRAAGGHMPAWSLNTSVLLQTATVLAMLWPGWGGRRTLRAAAITIVLAWSAEFLGAATGAPFGQYSYTDRLQPQLLHVPLLIPVAWLMMLPPAWAVAATLAGTRGISFALASAVAVTAWDLFLDPQMVAWDIWRWTQPGAYFGVPPVNFAGWVLTAALITLIVQPAHLPIRPLLLVYLTTWLLESVGLAFYFGLPGPAAVGFAAMGSIGMAAGGRLLKSGRIA